MLYRRASKLGNEALAKILSKVQASISRQEDYIEAIKIVQAPGLTHKH